ncbi:MAG: fumarylacetoacetate hydrolase family protein [Desulfopila sp.]
MRTVQVGKRWLAPSKIVCVGRNYVAHIEELGNQVADEMVIFCKPNSAIATTLKASHGGESLHYETEICYLVKGGRLAAVGCGLDLTKRALQTRLKEAGLPWERAKSFTGAALFSSFVPLPSPGDELVVELTVDGVLRQRGSTTMMLYSPPRILAELTTFMDLEDGDLIMTGTPAGVGVIGAGETFTARISTGEVILVEASWRAV